MTDHKKIAELNDAFRHSIGTNIKVPLGRLVYTQGVGALPFRDQLEIILRVREFSHFPEGDDPYSERDFGAFDYKRNKYFWKIDYYAPDMEHGSEDPADPLKTVRVLTIMLAEEY